MQDFYVYAHKRVDNGQIFYVGEGRLLRHTVSRKRSPVWNKIVKEAGGFTSEILYSELSKQEAMSKEYELISNPPKEWSLVNKRKIRQASNDIYTEHVRALFFYDENSPSYLSWKEIKAGNYRKSGYAGALDTRKGYWGVSVNKRRIAAHRVVWVLHYGGIPDGLVVNHIDNNPSNNNINNLELVTQAVNARRAVHHRDLSSTGINYCVVDNKYEYWIGYYHDTNSKRHSKSFNCKKHGHNQAKQMAIDWRLSNLKRLNEQHGAGYVLNEQGEKID